MSDLMQEVKKYIHSNVDKYNSLSKKIDENINGRVCHHKVEIINALIEVGEGFETYLEIGVHNGASMSYAVSTSKRINCYGIDLFEESRHPGSNAQAYWTKDGIHMERTRKNILSNNTSNSDVVLLKGDSTAQKTYDSLLNELKNQKVDLLFIDGNHHYNYVKKDFNRYSELVRPGGFVILDDYEPRYPGILKFAKEIDSSKYERLGVYKNNELILMKKENVET